LDALSLVSFDNLFISTDEPKHEIITQLIAAYPNATIVFHNPVKTIQFGSTAKHVILSHGSFSAIIGYLSFFSTVYYPKYGRMWHGDIFSIPSFIVVDGKNQIQNREDPTQEKNKFDLKEDTMTIDECLFLQRENPLTATEEAITLGNESNETNKKNSSPNDI
jgi:hypothetical protein